VPEFPGDLQPFLTSLALGVVVLQLREEALGLLEQPGVVDRHPGGCGQRGQHRLVVRVKRAIAALLGQIQVAVHLAAYSDRNPEEGTHRGVARRETGGRRVRADLLRAQRHRISDQLAEQPVAFRVRPDRRDLPLVYTDGDEPGQPVIRADDPERPVAGVDQTGRRLHAPIRVRIRRYDEPASPVPGGSRVRDHDGSPPLAVTGHSRLRAPTGYPAARLVFG